MRAPFQALMTEAVAIFLSDTSSDKKDVFKLSIELEVVSITAEPILPLRFLINESVRVRFDRELKQKNPARMSASSTSESPVSWRRLPQVTTGFIAEQSLNLQLSTVVLVKYRCDSVAWKPFVTLVPVLSKKRLSSINMYAPLSQIVPCSDLLFKKRHPPIVTLATLLPSFTLIAEAVSNDVKLLKSVLWIVTGDCDSIMSPPP